MEPHPSTGPGAERGLTPYPHPAHDSSGRPRRLDLDPALRVGELERATACDALAEHFAAGRLDPAELDDRVARALAARSQADLRVLFTDLGPRRPAPAATGPAPVERPRSAAVAPVLASVLVMSLLLAGGMLMVLGVYDFAFFLAALLGGTATAVAGSCATVLGAAALRRR